MTFREFLKINEVGTVGGPMGGPQASGALGMNVGPSSVGPTKSMNPPISKVKKIPASNMAPGTQPQINPAPSPLSPGVKSNRFPQASSLSPGFKVNAYPQPSPLSPRGLGFSQKPVGKSA